DHFTTISLRLFEQMGKSQIPAGNLGESLDGSSMRFDKQIIVRAGLVVILVRAPHRRPILDPAEYLPIDDRGMLPRSFCGSGTIGSDLPNARCLPHDEKRAAPYRIPRTNHLG